MGGDMELKPCPFCGGEVIPELHWHVFVDDFNRKRIVEYDIFEHYSFAEDVREAYRKHRDDFDAFAEKVRGLLLYYYWSKCEWEVVVGSWVSGDRVPKRKVDVYEQVMLNWDVFIGYVWHQAHALRRKGSEG